jgi:murein DD-endopeptidase MepM/ murein hydrolase activator NlpD
MMWPIPSFWIIDTGESVLKKRAHKNQPHSGVDIHCNAGTPVLAAAAGTVIAVVDGRKSSKAETRAAGLFVEIDDNKEYIFRYLHLGECAVSSGTDGDRRAVSRHGGRRAYERTRESSTSSL